MPLLCICIIKTSRCSFMVDPQEVEFHGSELPLFFGLPDTPPCHRSNEASDWRRVSNLLNRYRLCVNRRCVIAGFTLRHSNHRLSDGSIMRQGLVVELEYLFANRARDSTIANQIP